MGFEDDTWKVRRVWRARKEFKDLKEIMELHSKDFLEFKVLEDYFKVLKE